MSTTTKAAHTPLRWDRQIAVIWRDNPRFAGKDMGSDEIACDVEEEYGPMFAAAPEMLEALEGWINVSSTDLSYYKSITHELSPLEQRDYDLLKKTVAAIQKAKGGQ